MREERAILFIFTVVCPSHWVFSRGSLLLSMALIFHSSALTHSEGPALGFTATACLKETNKHVQLDIKCVFKFGLT